MSHPVTSLGSAQLVSSPDFVIPGDMLAHINRIFMGEYACSWYPRHTTPVIMDVGANIGGFTIWAHSTWPHGEFHCFEPVVDTFNRLERNLQHITDAFCYNFALGAPRVAPIHYGLNNRGESSLHVMGEQQAEPGEDVVVRDPVDFADILRRTTILKIDAEGEEVEILRRIHAAGLLASVLTILVEYHSEALRREIDALLLDFSLMESSFWTYRSGGTSGLLKYAKLPPYEVALAHQQQQQR